MCSELDYVTLFEYFLRLFSTTVRSWLEGDLHLLLSPFLRRGNLALLKTATKILHGNLSDDVDHVMEYACVEALAIAVAERGQKALVEEYLELGRVDLEGRFQLYFAHSIIFLLGTMFTLIFSKDIWVFVHNMPPLWLT